MGFAGQLPGAHTYPNPGVSQQTRKCPEGKSHSMTSLGRAASRSCSQGGPGSWQCSSSSMPLAPSSITHGDGSQRCQDPAEEQPNHTQGAISTKAAALVFIPATPSKYVRGRFLHRATLFTVVIRWGPKQLVRAKIHNATKVLTQQPPLTWSPLSCTPGSCSDGQRRPYESHPTPRLDWIPFTKGKL